MKILKRSTKKKKAFAMAKGCAYNDLYARFLFFLLDWKLLDWKQKKVKMNCTDWLGRETEQGKMYSK